MIGCLFGVDSGKSMIEVVDQESGVSQEAATKFTAVME